MLAALSAGGLLGNAFLLAADYVSRRVMASLGALSTAVCLFAFGLGHSLPVLVGAAFFWGASSDALLHAPEFALMDLVRSLGLSVGLGPEDEAEERAVAVALSRANALSAIGDLLGPLTLSGVAALELSWRAAFFAGGALLLAYAGWLASQPIPKPLSAPEEPPAAAILSVLRDRTVLLLGVVDTLYGLLDEPLLGFFTAFLERIRAFTPAAATAFVAVIVVSGFAGYLAVPVLRPSRAAPDSDRAPTAAVAYDGPISLRGWSAPLRARASRLLKRIHVSSASAILLVLGTAVLVSVSGLILAPAWWLLLPPAAVFGFAGAAFYSILEATYLSLHPGQAGATSAINSTIGFAGLGFPAAVGALADAHGLTIGLSLYAAVPAVMLVLLLLARPSLRNRAERSTYGTGQ